MLAKHSHLVDRAQHDRRRPGVDRIVREQERERRRNIVRIIEGARPVEANDT
jgi:hypothetical protein